MTNQQRHKIESIAKENNINTILWGSGYDCDKPNIVVVADWFDCTINVHIYPEGKGYNKPSKCITLD